MAHILTTAEQLVAYDLGSQLIALRRTEVQAEQVGAENEVLKLRVLELEAANSALTLEPAIDKVDDASPPATPAAGDAPGTDHVSGPEVRTLPGMPIPSRRFHLDKSAESGGTSETSASSARQD